MNTQTSQFLKILKMFFDEQKEFMSEEPVDWSLLSKMARKQNLLPIFFEAANNCEDYINSDIYTKDQMDTYAMVAAQIQRSSAFLEIYEKITKEGIYPIVMKGIVCRQLYGEMSDHRPSGDEDILIEPKDFQKVKEILEKEHYVCSNSEITDRELAKVQEVSFHNLQQSLHVDVHNNMIGNQNSERAQMNSLFLNVHAHGQMVEINGTPVKVLEPTESLLFLILHSYKHFQNRGVGIRQVLDILLYYKANRQKINMEKLQSSLCTCSAEGFWSDILYIGYTYLGLCEERPESVCCPEELIQDMMQTGVFGEDEKSDHIAARMNLAADDSANKRGKLYRLLCVSFPKRQVLLDGYPFLEEKPWLLPFVWGKRWKKFLKYAKKDVWKLSREILEKNSARMEDIKKYKN